MSNPPPGGRLLVRGGTVVTPEGARRADLAVEDGRIEAVLEPGGAAGARSGEVLDASGCLVLPGGVDPHCHVMDGVAAATRAAALGGTTTVLSFTNPDPGEPALDCLLRRRQALAESAPAVDVGLHAMLHRPDEVTAGELEALREQGCSGVKVFLAYPELGIMWSAGGLFELLRLAARSAQVVQVHCEQGEVIERLVAAAVASGRRGPALFAETRPPETEAPAVALALATGEVAGATCYVTHISCSGALEQVRLARRLAPRGTERPLAWAEACLHHLLLDDGHYGGADAERFLVAPPLRDRAHLAALWEAVADGTLDTVGSDHSQVKSLTEGRLSPEGSGYAYGLAGIGARLPLVLSEGLRRKVPVERLVDLLSANPARAFGHYPRKGAIVRGADADLVVYDPAARFGAGAWPIDDGTGDSLYAAEPPDGLVRDVLVRGRAVVAGGRHVAAEPFGRFTAPLRARS